MEDTTKKRKREEDADSKKEPAKDASLERRDGEGMHPKSILMGIYGPRGEKIRHTVHTGAMKLPASAITILKNTQDECTKHATPKKTYQLPAIDGVIRPTMDNEHYRSIIITELTATERPPPQVTLTLDPLTGQMIPTAPPPLKEKWQTNARNWKLKLPSKAEIEERIRGGGGEDDDDVEMEDVAALAGERGTSPDASHLPPKKRGLAAADVAPSGEAAPSVESAAAKTTTTENAATATASQVAKSPSTADQKPVASTGESAPAAATSTEAASTSAATATATSSASTGTDSQKAPFAVPSAAPAAVTSSSSTTSTSKGKTKVPAVIPLPTKPKPQWEQHVPGPNDEMQSEPKSGKPSWYSSDEVSDLEKSMLPEWFDGSASHRTADSYKQARERMIEISDRLAQRYLTGTLVRRTVPGDAGSLLRLHNFLTTWGLINEDAINDSAPTAPGFRQDAAASRYSKTNVVWNEAAREELMKAVVDQSNKRRKTDQDTSFVPIDWDEVSKRVDNGASASDCEKVFLALPLEAAAQKLGERSITPDVTSSEQKDDGTDNKVKMDLKEKILKDIVDAAPPEVVKAATDAALAATDNVAEAQKAGLLAVVASEAAARAKQEEATVSRLLAELHEQRLQKLENRMALLDDVEGVLEAERVALELERRDLYTARCRHWFGGAS